MKKGLARIPSYFSDLEAPSGCLQYFRDSFGTLTSFNFDGYSTFAPDQDYAICIRGEGNSPSGRTCGVTLRATSFGLPVNGYVDIILVLKYILHFWTELMINGQHIFLSKIAI